MRERSKIIETDGWCRSKESRRMDDGSNWLREMKEKEGWGKEWKEMKWKGQDEKSYRVLIYFS